MGIKRSMRYGLRALARRFPQLMHYSGRLGLGRWTTSNSVRERILVDDDIVVELDLSIPTLRAYFFFFDPSSKLETHLIRRLVTPVDSFVDAGGNIGLVTLIAAKYAGKVFAFEPSPTTYDCLQSNLQLNPRLMSKVSTYNLALSDHTGVADLYRPSAHPDEASLKPVGTEPTETEFIELDMLDHVLSGERITFLKVDVEGSELDVLKGGSEIISRDCPLILCELNETFQNRFGHTCQDIVDHLSDYGYQAYFVRTDPSAQSTILVDPLDLSYLSSNGMDMNNALFIPAARVTEVLDRLTTDRTK